MFIDKNIKFYFIGIGGISMSALAIYLTKKGFLVAGSDRSNSEIIKNLQSNNVNVVVGSRAYLIKHYDVIVYSSAVSDDNSELKVAKELNKKILTRAELLSLILNSYRNTVGIAGSHGKTTACCMLAHILRCANIPITAFIGGMDLDFDNLLTNGVNTAISEVCEYKGNIDKINTKTGVVLNIDSDHLDYYQNLQNLKKAFFFYLDRSKIKVVNVDDENLKSYANDGLITYAIQSKADYQAVNLRSVKGKYIFEVLRRGKHYLTCKLNVYGEHNVYNALSVIAVCDFVFKISKENVYNGLLGYKGCKRRFEKLGEYNGAEVIADYCHHPSEIEKTLKVAKELFNKNYLIVFQAHTYSRTKLLFEDFCKVFKNENVVFYKTYSARETFSNEGSIKKVAFKISKNYIENFEEIKEFIVKNKNLKAILILGAGDVYDIAKKYFQNKKRT